MQFARHLSRPSCLSQINTNIPFGLFGFSADIQKWAWELKKSATRYIQYIQFIQLSSSSSSSGTSGKELSKGNRAGGPGLGPMEGIGEKVVFFCNAELTDANALVLFFFFTSLYLDNTCLRGKQNMELWAYDDIVLEEESRFFFSCLSEHVES